MVSLGDEEKLNKFLEVFPDIPRDVMYVDDSRDFALYEACGFGKFTDAKPSKEQAKLKPTNFTFGDWWSYLSNVAKLAPIRKGEPGVPEGVLRLGGTFVLAGDDVEYAFADALPGAHPEIRDVLAKVGIA
jgi:hypothetical protein